MRFRTFFMVPFLAAMLMAAEHQARASVYRVTVDSPALMDVPAVLVFDFIDGGPPSNAITLSSITSDGTQSSTSASGAVTGTGPWTFADTSFFDELLVSFSRIGSPLSFTVTTTDNAPSPGAFPDAFSFFVLTSDLTMPLITTDDPTGADALFLLSDAQGPGNRNVYALGRGTLTVDSALGIPEPGSLALLAAALAALLSGGCSMQHRRAAYLRSKGQWPNASRVGVSVHARLLHSHPARVLHLSSANA